MQKNNNQKGAETSIGIKCSCKRCENKAVVRAYYEPYKNMIEEPRELCNDCYEKVDKDTGTKMYQVGLDRVEIL